MRARGGSIVRPSPLPAAPRRSPRTPARRPSPRVPGRAPRAWAGGRVGPGASRRRPLQRARGAGPGRLRRPLFWVEIVLGEVFWKKRKHVKNTPVKLPRVCFLPLPVCVLISPPKFPGFARKSAANPSAIVSHRRSGREREVPLEPLVNHKIKGYSPCEVRSFC